MIGQSSSLQRIISRHGCMIYIYIYIYITYLLYFLSACCVCACMGVCVWCWGVTSYIIKLQNK